MIKIVPARRPLLEVRWRDSFSSGSWKTSEELEDWTREGCECVTVGFLVREDRVNLVLASTFHGDNVGGTWAIPRACVVSRRRLR